MMNLFTCSPNLLSWYTYSINTHMPFGEFDHSRVCMTEILMSPLERIYVLLNLMSSCTGLFFSSRNFEVVQSQPQKG